MDANTRRYDVRVLRHPGLSPNPVGKAELQQWLDSLPDDAAEGVAMVAQVVTSARRSDVAEPGIVPIAPDPEEM